MKLNLSFLASKIMLRLGPGDIRQSKPLIGATGLGKTHLSVSSKV